MERMEDPRAEVHEGIHSSENDGNLGPEFILFFAASWWHEPKSSRAKNEDAGKQQKTQVTNWATQKTLLLSTLLVV